MFKKSTDRDHGVPYSRLCAAELRDDARPKIDSQTTSEIPCGMLKVILECATLAPA
jgi:hypothetical protein